MKYQLSIPERFGILGLLPEAGDIHFWRITQDLVRLVGFTDDELGRWKIRKTGDSYSWTLSEGEDATVEVEIEPAGSGVIRETLAALSKNKLLRREHVSLYEKFVEGGHQ